MELRIGSLSAMFANGMTHTAVPETVRSEWHSLLQGVYSSTFWIQDCLMTVMQSWQAVGSSDNHAYNTYFICLNINKTGMAAWC